MGNLNRERRRADNKPNKRVYSIWAKDRKGPPPSRRPFPEPMQVPDGTFDVWRVAGYAEGKGVRYFGIYLDSTAAFNKADEVFRDPTWYLFGIRVEHKAAIRLPNGKFYIVNIPAITITDELDQASLPVAFHGQAAAYREDSVSGNQADRPAAIARILSRPTGIAGPHYEREVWRGDEND